jgi:hypothetical protein
MARPTKTTDFSVEHAKAVMREQIQNMEHVSANVMNLKGEIPAGFSAHAVGVYQDRMDDWNTAYKKIKEQFEDALRGFGHAHNGIDHHHDVAVQLAGNSFAGGVYSGLK